MIISLPSKPIIVSEEGNVGVFEIEGLHPGYGQTIGNSLRRVLLSSLPGAAITAVKIDGVAHEFSTIEGVMEDVVTILLNLKQMHFRLHGEGPQTITLSAKGEREVTGKDFETPSQVEVVTPDVYIAALSSPKSVLKLEATVEAGLGYVPVEGRTKEKVEVGTIMLDAAFSPVRHAKYDVENMRVGDRTDYNRLRLTIETDGSITAREALERAAAILVEQFGTLTHGFAAEAESPSGVAASAVEAADGGVQAEESEESEAAMRMKLDELKLSSRTLNALREAGIKTVAGLSRKREESLHEVPGIGEKGIQEIKKALGNLGITLKQ